MRKLFLIPARGGSKGLPQKNILNLAGRPMIYYTLDAAIDSMDSDDELCVSTDNDEIIKTVEKYGLKVKFKRPDELASDTASTEDVLDHTLKWYESRGVFFDIIILLQVTSPLRNSVHIKKALNLFDKEIDLIVSVRETDSNPYYVLFEENKNGFLEKSKKGNFTRRQDCPIVYELNGAIYIYNSLSLKNKKISEFKRVKKYIMNKRDSIDIDNKIDFQLAEILMNNKI